MGFWDVAGKIAKTTWNLAQDAAARERERMKDPRYREAKREMRELRDLESSMNAESRRADRELDRIMGKR